MTRTRCQAKNSEESSDFFQRSIAQNVYRPKLIDTGAHHPLPDETVQKIDHRLKVNEKCGPNLNGQY